MVITILKKQIAQRIASYSDNFTADDIYSMLEYPSDPQMGDLAFPCFKLSKLLHKSPIQIAQSLSADFKLEYIERTEAVNGYLNLYISEKFYTVSLLSDILSRRETYGSSDIGNGKTVVIDYSSPNIAKPFHIGHLGTTVIGHSVKKLHEFAGYKCIGINHLGDWGTQFGKLIVAYKKWGDKELTEQKGIDELVELYVHFHKEAESDSSLEDAARAEFTKLEHGDGENTALWKWFIDISLKEYEKTYKQLGIVFDYYTGESFYYDKTKPVLDKLKECGLLKVDNGATIVDLEKYNMPPCMILKSDGSTIYAIRDITAAIYRKGTFNFDKCICVTSSGQCLYFSQWFKVVELMGYEWASQLVHVSYGTVSINGSKLATRTGNVVLLKDLFAAAIEKVSEIITEKNPNLENKDEVAEAVGVGAIVFHYLSNSKIKDTNFIMEDALSFDGDTGPYAQYTYARTNSILEKAGTEPSSDIEGYSANSVELSLLRELALFPEKVLAALKDYEPSVIVRYILDLCADFNRFYHECQIINAESNKAKNFRIQLTAAVKYTLGNALELICLKKTQKI